MLSKEALLKARFGEEEVEIPGVGSVRVRSLTRAQALQVQGVEMDAAEMERKLISWAMAEPKMSEDEVRQWQEASPAGELQAVTDVIVRLSGMEKHAAKEAMKRFHG